MPSKMKIKLSRSRLVFEDSLLARKILLLRKKWSVLEKRYRSHLRKASTLKKKMIMKMKLKPNCPRDQEAADLREEACQSASKVERATATA